MHLFDVFYKMTKKRWVFFTTFLTLSVLWAGVIFGFSATDGGQSVKQSNGFIEILYNLLPKGESEITNSTVLEPKIDKENAQAVQEQEKVTEQEIKIEETEKKEIKEEIKKEEIKKEEVTKQGGNKQEATPQKTKEEQNDISELKPVQNVTNDAKETIKEPAKERNSYILNENTNILTDGEKEKEERIRISIEKNENIPMFAALNTIVRKFAHISSYALLAFLVYFAVGAVSDFPKKNASVPWMSVTLCVLFACTDEYHQSFVYGRSGRISDVIVDSFGIFVGTLIAFWLAEGIAKIKRKS